MSVTPVVRTIAATIHGRYLVRLVPSGADGWIVAFHGYAQDCATVLEEVERIAGADRWNLVSVQGLHRFYNRAEQVVASWMTREDRELAIADNLAYVRGVVNDAREGEDAGARLPLVFLGFSQGAAMAYRAAAHIPCAGLIALGGDIPPDVRAAGTPLAPVLLGRGTQDPWYTEDKLRTDAEWLRSTGTAADIVSFDGGHEWTAAFRDRAATFLQRIGRRIT